jgi:Flp pilus assembly pilin Flp
MIPNGVDRRVRDLRHEASETPHEARTAHRSIPHWYHWLSIGRTAGPFVLLSVAPYRRTIEKLAGPGWRFRVGYHMELSPMTLIRSVKGQGLAEYALILALIAILAITALLFLSGRINTILSTIGAKL